MKLVVVDGNLGTYVLQCPDPSYATRWDMCFKHFQGAEMFEGIEPKGPCPSWFEERLWNDLKDEYKRWKASGKDVDPPEPPATTQAERTLMKLESELAYYRGVMRNSRRGLDWCKAKKAEYRVPAPKSKRAMKVRTIHGDNMDMLAARAAKLEQDFRRELQVSAARVKLLKPKLQPARKKCQPQPASTPPPIPESTPTPTPSPPQSPSPPPAPSPTAEQGDLGIGQSNPSVPPPRFAHQRANMVDESDIVPLPRPAAPPSDMELSDLDSEAGAADALGDRSTEEHGGMTEGQLAALFGHQAAF